MSNTRWLPRIPRFKVEKHRNVARPRSSLFALPLMVCALLALTGTTAAQAQELFKVLPSNQLQDATPVQNEAIQKLRQRPTTQSLDLVQVDVNALRGDTTQLAIPNSPLRVRTISPGTAR
jgi:predicted PurR-regulated permease PerM